MLEIAQNVKKTWNFEEKKSYARKYLQSFEKISNAFSI